MKSKLSLFAIFLVAMTVYSFTCTAQKGQLDLSFNKTGKDTLEIRPFYIGINRIIALNNAQIIAAGDANVGSRSIGAVMRYNNDGTVDTTFGKNGVDTFTNMLITAMAIQKDGKIVLGGYKFFHSRELLEIARLDSNGQIDKSFGYGGFNLIYTNYGNGVTDLKINKVGKILVAGFYEDSATQSFFSLTSFNSNGQIDTLFGTDKGVTHTYIYGDAKANTMGIDSATNDIVLGGYSYDGSNYYFTLTRYDSLGKLETGFGTFGIVTQSLCSQKPAFDIINSLVIQNNGKIVAAGESEHIIDTAYVRRSHCAF